MIVSPVDRGSGQPPLGAGQKQVQHLSAKPHHQRLAFRIAEADVVFDQPRPAFMDHQPRVEDTLEGHSPRRHLGHGRAHDLRHHLFLQCVRQDRRGAVCAHAASVGAVVPFAHALVVLGCAQGQAVGPVAQDEEAGFLARHEFFDDDRHLAEFAVEDRVDRPLRLFHGFGHGHALACGQPVGLDHDGGAMGGDMFACACGIGETRPGCSGRPAGIADFLGKGL